MADSTYTLNGNTYATGTTSSPGNVLNSPNLNNSSVDTTPSASDVSNTSPLTIPTAPNNGTAPAQSIMGITQGLNASQQALQDEANNAVNDAANNYNSTANSISGMIGNYLNKGNDQLNLEAQNNIPNLRTTANNLTTQYQTKQLAYNNQYNAIFQNPYITAEGAAQQINDLNQLHSYDLANTGIMQAIAQNQYQTAQTLVDHQIDVKYSPLKDSIDFGMQFLANNKDILTQAEQNKYQTNIAIQSQKYTEGSYNAHLVSDGKVQFLQTASANGAPQDVLRAIQAATDLGTAAQAGGQYLKNSSYSPIQTGIDENTGLPIYSTLNTKTGALEPLNPGGHLGASGSSNTVVNGYQMGATSTLGAYASATDQQVSNIKNTVSRIQSTVGTITDVKTAQAAINAVSPNSPITGQMVMNSAQKYGVDPSVLIGVMQAETQCGTDSSAGSKGCNWGNVGNTDQAMAQGKPISLKPQEGVDAVAQNLAKRQVTSGQIDPAKPADNTGHTPQQIANETIKAAPQLIQSSMSFLPSTGDVYIDSSKLNTDSQKYIANAYVANHPNTRLLTASEASDAQAVDTALKNLDQIESQFTQIAPNNIGGKFIDSFINPLKQTFNIGSGDVITGYQDTTLPSAIGALKIVAGSARLSQYTGSITEKSLPVVMGRDNVSIGGTDTKGSGLIKINTLRTNLNNALKSIFPNSSGVQPTTADTKIHVQILGGPKGTINPNEFDPKTMIKL